MRSGGFIKDFRMNRDTGQNPTSNQQILNTYMCNWLLHNTYIDSYPSKLGVQH